MSGKSERKELRAAWQRAAEQQKLFRTPVVLVDLRPISKVVKGQPTRPRPIPRRPNESLLDKVLSMPSHGGKRITTGPFMAVRRVIAHLYEMELEQVRMNTRLKRINPRLAYELYRVTAKQFDFWAGMTVEELAKSGR